MKESKMDPTLHNNSGVIEPSEQNFVPLDQASTENQLEGNSRTSILSHFLNRKIETFTFLFTFSSVLTQITSTTMILDKVCIVHLGYNHSICSDLENHTEIKHSVEKLATNYQLGRTLIQTAPAAMLACFIGPWSDLYGRKFPIMIALFGMLIDSLGSTICAYFFESRIEYYFIPAVFSGLFGGSVSIKAVIYSSCSDSTTLFARTMKYAFIEMAIGFATSFGSTAGGWIYKDLGFTAVFLFSAGGLCLSFIYGVFLKKETRGLDCEDPWSVKLRKLFSCKMLLDGFNAVTKKRPHKGRGQIVLLIISMCFLVIAMNSTGDINYLYAHHQFDWDNTTYSNISAIYAAVGIVVLVIIIPLLRYFRIDDSYLGLLGTISLLGKSLGVGLSRNLILYHIGNVIGFLGGCALFAGRSRISKVAHEDELGTIFTFVAAAEALFPILTSVLTSQLFAASLDFFPGLPYIALGILLILPIGVFSWMTCLPKMTFPDLERMKELKENA